MKVQSAPTGVLGLVFPVLDGKLHRVFNVENWNSYDR